MGGLNYDANREIAELRIQGLQMQDIEDVGAEWYNIDYSCYDSI